MKKEQQVEVAYVAPVVKVIEMEVEKGFAVSPGLYSFTPDSDDSEFW